jgi:hypothetical protein
MDTLPPCESGDPAIAAYVAQLLQTTATMMLIVDDLMRFAASRRPVSGAPPVNEVLAKLLCSLMPALLADHSPAAIERATAVLHDADAIIGRELVVAAPEPARSHERRPGTPRARRR